MIEVDKIVVILMVYAMMKVSRTCMFMCGLFSGNRSSVEASLFVEGGTKNYLGGGDCNWSFSNYTVLVTKDKSGLFLYAVLRDGYKGVLEARNNFCTDTGKLNTEGALCTGLECFTSSCSNCEVG